MHTRNLILSNNIYVQILVNKQSVNQPVELNPSDEEPVQKDDLITVREVFASTDVRYKKVSDPPRKNKVVNCCTLMYS